MKKCFLLFVTVLMGTFSTIATAQTDDLLNIAGLEPDLSGNTTYYLKNVGTGLYMSYGGEWGTHCIETQQAHPIVVEDNGDGTVAIGSIGGYLESNTLWMDSTRYSSDGVLLSKWRLEKVEGYENQYYLYGDGDRVLTSVGNSAGLLSLNTLDNKAMQRWIFTNGADIKNNKMPNASVDAPFDVTVSIRGGAFDLVDGWDQESLKNIYTPNKVPEGIRNSTNIPNPYHGNWANYTDKSKYVWHCGYRSWNPNEYAWCGIIYGDEKELTITYTMNLLEGTYHFSFEGFYKYMRKGALSGLSDNGKMDAKVTIAGKEIKLDSYGTDNSVYIDGENAETDDREKAGARAAMVFRDNDNYKKQTSFYLSSDQQVSIVIYKPKTSGNGLGTSYPSQIYFDDFTLLYYGKKDVTSTLEANANYTSFLYANIEEYKSQWNEEGQAAFDEIFPIEDVADVITRADYYDALQALEEARKAGVLAHNRAEIYENAMETGNFTDAISNHSFELGTLEGWTIPSYSSDTNVYLNGTLDWQGKPAYQTDGIDGNYLFNTWWQGVPITQTVTDLPNGVYRLNVLVASGDAGNDATVYLLANDEKLGVNPPSGGKTFGDFYLKFLVTDGTATIGVVGGADDDTPENPVGSYVEGGHWWYKCDNFRLEYLKDDHLKLDQTATKIDKRNEIFAKITLERPIAAGEYWNTFVVPFNMEIPAGWEVMELTGSEKNDDCIMLEFSEAGSIEAGVPYMVRVPEAVSEVTVENAIINTTALKPTETDYVTFVGSYVARNIPTGSYFINNNKFFRSVNAENPDKIKGFRGYFTPKGTENAAMSFSFRMGDEETTLIDNSLINNSQTVVYDLMGRRVDNPTKGVYIVNGKKTVIK